MMRMAIWFFLNLKNFQGIVQIPVIFQNMNTIDGLIIQYRKYGSGFRWQLVAIFLIRKDGMRYYCNCQSNSYETANCFLGFGLASSFFGISTISIPFLCSALIFSVSTYEGQCPSNSQRKNCRVGKNKLTAKIVFRLNHQINGWCEEELRKTGNSFQVLSVILKIGLGARFFIHFCPRIKWINTKN